VAVKLVADGREHVRFGSFAEIGEQFRDVRLLPNIGHPHRRNLCLL